MTAKNISVLVVDGTPRHTIDIVRSLGKHEISVSIVSSERYPPARFSRYLHEQIVSRSSSTILEDMADELVDIAGSGRFDVFIASGLTGFRALSYAAPRLSPYVRVPIVDFDKFTLAEDKGDITRYAEAAGVPVPTTYYPFTLDDLSDLAHIRYPVIVKARRGQGHFAYAANHAELLQQTYPSICAQVPDQIRAGIMPIVQELVRGKGHGFYALMNQGRLKSYFMHERVHEVPPSGGPSAMAKSYYDEELIAVGSQLLQELGWHGVAMVEFKKDRDDGQYKLIEINPKFWGSLGLSIAAGVDFPYLLVKMALAGDVEFVPPPRDPVLYQWLSMDMAHSWAVHRPFLWLKSVLQGVPNDFRFNDPLPNLALIGQGGMDVLRGNRSVTKPGDNQVG